MSRDQAVGGYSMSINFGLVVGDQAGLVNIMSRHQTSRLALAVQDFSILISEANPTHIGSFQFI